MADERRDFLRCFAERGLISKYAVPEQIHVLEALPKTSVGRQDKKTLRQ
jgi:fatty-acyl-CoA synthase